MTFALVVLPVGLLLAGFPIYLVLLASAAAALVFFMNVPLAVLHQNLYGAIDSFALLAVPFFLYAGELMGRGSVAARIVDVVQGAVGSVRGSLGITTVGTSAIFGAISGASAATVATVGKIMLPAMRRARYPEPFSAGLITAVGAIDIIIPPSIPMIIYGMAAEESVPRLYAAGVLPGTADRCAARRLRVLVRAAHRHARGRRLRRPRASARSGARRVGARRTGDHPRRHLRRGVLAGRGGRGSHASMQPRHAHRLSRALVARGDRRRCDDRAAHRAGADHRRVRGRLLVGAHRQPGAGEAGAWIQTLALEPWSVLAAINLLLLAVGCFIDPCRRSWSSRRSSCRW